MSVCKNCAEELELRVIRYQYMVEKYLSIFADVSYMLQALGDKNFSFCHLGSLSNSIFTFTLSYTKLYHLS